MAGSGLRHRAGHVVLSASPAEGVMRGEIFVPIGPYANHIISSETHATGMPDFKSQVVDVQATDERVSVSGSLWKHSEGCGMLVNDVVCPFCGCLCDDLELEVGTDRVIRVQNGCALAEATFMNDTRLPARSGAHRPAGRIFRTTRRLKRPQTFSGTPTGPCCTAGAAPTAKPRVLVCISPSVSGR